MNELKPCCAVGQSIIEGDGKNVYIMCRVCKKRGEAFPIGPRIKLTDRRRYHYPGLAGAVEKAMTAWNSR